MQEKVIEIIKTILENSDKELTVTNFTSDTHFRNDLNFDSFNLAELTVHIEEEFDIDVFENGVVNTFGELIDILKKA